MEAKDQILARMYVVLTLLGLLPVLVAGQVLWIYVAEREELQAEGRGQTNSSVTIPAMRGSILDRAGRMLAVNTGRYDLALDPTIEGFQTQASSFFEKLARLTGQRAAAYRRRVRERSSPQYVMLARGLWEAQKEVIDTWDVPGLILQPTFARRYNYGTTAAHVLGHVSADGHGLAGVELQYDEYLRGEPGRRAVKRDRRGVVKTFVGGSVVEPKHGQTLVLTLDLVRQAILEEELARGVAESEANWGTAVAMDPHTGAILALANVPTYNPNNPSGFSSAERRNRAITDRMEPGSTFKLVGAVTAVEQGVVAMGDSIETGDGWIVIHGRTLKDTHAHGTISFAEVIAKSSNVGMAKVAQQLEPGVFFQYARNLGFGQPTWIDLPGEVGGLLKKPAAWSGTTLTSMSRGYEVDVTPLQVLAAYSALANGGLLVQPYILAERRDLTGRTLWQAQQDSVRRAFKRTTARTLLPAFEQVVNNGTATQAQIKGLPVAGKTGTARKTEGGRYGSAYRASFVGFFPADHPAVAMIVVLDEPRSHMYGGVVAAPVFRRIAKRWLATFPKIAERMAPPIQLPETGEQPVPDVASQPVRIAEDRLQAAGYRVRSERTDGAVVTRQEPFAGDTMRTGAYVRLAQATIPPGTVTTMPDLTGLSARQAVYWLRARGVTARVEGRGRVTHQSPAAGAALPTQAVLRCQ